MNKQYDVIICGAGPAGSLAGLDLARQGHSVLLLDRARFPRPKLCGGLLTWKTVRLLETVTGDTPGTLADKGIICHQSDRYSINTLDRLLVAGDLSFPFHFVDRTLFDHHLLTLATDAGAELREATPVLGCDPADGTVTLANGESVRARFIIGADGANSVTRKVLPGLDKRHFRANMAPALEIHLTPSEFPRPVTHPELYIGQLRAGYGWAFPGRESVVVGICGLRTEAENFSDLFREYLTGLGVDPYKAAPFHGHPLPYGNYLAHPAHDRLLLAGDAAGLVEPLFGEGIFFSLCSGHYAGRAVAQALADETDPGPLYIDRLHTQILPELRASDRFRWTLFKAMQYGGPSGIGLFVKSLARPLSEMVHGIRSYSWLRKKDWDFLK